MLWISQLRFRTRQSGGFILPSLLRFQRGRLNLLILRIVSSQISRYGNFGATIQRRPATTLKPGTQMRTVALLFPSGESGMRTYCASLSPSSMFCQRVFMQVLEKVLKLCPCAR